MITANRAPKLNVLIATVNNTNKSDNAHTLLINATPAIKYQLPLIENIEFEPLALLADFLFGN